MKPLLQPVLFLFFIATACTKEAPASGDDVTSASGVITGKVTDASGKPLSGIKVVIEHTVWNATYIFATTNAAGTYKADLPAEPAGSWTAKAQIKRAAYGQEYTFDLAVDKTDAFTRKQATVRNFTWKLSGQKGDGAYYGAHVDVYPWGLDADMEKVRLIFTPYDAGTTLIDGSAVPTLERTVKNVAGTFMVNDIPVGKYWVMAKYGGKTLTLKNRHLDEQPDVFKPVVFGKNGYLGETEYNIEFYLSE